MQMVMIMTEVFQFLIKQSISISYIIIFVMIVRFLLKRFPKKYAYALWMIVAIPLLIPWHVESEFTLHPKMETTMTQTLIASSIPKDTEDSMNIENDDIKPVSYAHLTSSVYTRLERMLQDAMQKVMKGRTSFVIAHRLSTIRNADLILVIQNGDIVEQGTHESLMAKKGFYEKLYNSQFQEEED